MTANPDTHLESSGIKTQSKQLGEYCVYQTNT